jgi:hypothetical protein
MITQERLSAMNALARLLDNAPSWGEIGIIIHIHDGAFARLEERRAESIKLGLKEPIT